MDKIKIIYFATAATVATILAHSSRAQPDKPLAGSQIRVAENIETKVLSKPLDDKVNTPFMELGPTVTKDGSRLYFSRQGYSGNMGGAQDEDIWFSDFDIASQSWKEAISIGEPLNNYGPNFICGVGVNGDTLLLGNAYNRQRKMSAGLSISIRSGDSWGFPITVYVENNYNLSGRTSFDISSDRKALLIAQNKTDTHGGLDLYVSFRTHDSPNPYAGTESINLGPVVNSVGDETSPFLAYDNRTLYFSSNGHKGYGKYDLFVTHRLDESWTNWSQPENLGPGVNSSDDDTSFGFTPRGRYAYYSRGLTPVNSDIYRLDMTYLFKPSSKPLGQMGELIVDTQIGQSLVLDSVFLDDQFEMRTSADKKFASILNYLRVFSNYQVLISTHANQHDSREKSQVLSEARAVKVRDYLVSKGIKADQLEYRGYGHDIVVNMDNLPTLKSMKSRVASSVEFRLVGFSNRKKD